MANTVPLSKPLKSHQGEITELTLRELTARDIVEARQSPIKIARVGEEVVHEYRYDVVMKLASMMTGHDEGVLGGLKGGDFHKLTAAVVDEWNRLGE